MPTAAVQPAVFAPEQLRTAWAALYGHLPQRPSFGECMADPLRSRLLRCYVAAQQARLRRLVHIGSFDHKAAAATGSTDNTD